MLYIVMILNRWNKVEFEPAAQLQPRFNARIAADPGQVGFLQVYDDYKKALEEAGDPALIYAIKEVERK